MSSFKIFISLFITLHNSLVLSQMIKEQDGPYITYSNSDITVIYNTVTKEYRGINRDQNGNFLRMENPKEILNFFHQSEANQSQSNK